jgi:phage terminase small subunit
MSDKLLKPLTPKQKAFCIEYIKTGNGTQSYIAAGYSKQGASQSAVTLLQHPSVKAHIALAQVKTEKKLALTAERIMSELADIALLDPASMYDEAGNMLKVKDMPESTRRAIASVEHDKGFTKLRMNSKLTALELAAKILNMTKQDQVQVAIATVILQDKPVSELPVIDQALALKPEW